MVFLFSCTSAKLVVFCYPFFRFFFALKTTWIEFVKENNYLFLVENKLIFDKFWFKPT